MRILFLAPSITFPPHGGGALRVYNLATHLAKRHEVTLVGFTGDNSDTRFAVTSETGLKRVIRIRRPMVPPERHGGYLLHHMPDVVRTYRANEMQCTLQRLMTEETFDVIYAEEAVMAQYIVQTAYNAPVILGRQKIDSHFYRQVFAIRKSGYSWRKRIYEYVQWLKWQRYEKELCRPFHFHVTVSQKDKSILQKHDSRAKIFVVPNGVDTDYFSYQPLPAESEFSVVFVGSMSYAPNVDGVKFYAKEVVPKLRARYSKLKTIVVGRDPPQEIMALSAQPGLIVTGAVEDVRPYIYGSSLSIVPLRIGGGTRLKILESLASGRPVVSTTVGAEGVPYSHGQNIMIADEPIAFANHVVDILEDCMLASKLARNGREFVEANYDWSIIAERLVAVFSEAISSWQKHH